MISNLHQRGIHDINRPFVFASNPQFIFHDSPGLEAGDESQINQIKDFIAERAKSTEVNDQLHAIWSVDSLAIWHCSSVGTGIVLSLTWQGFC